jgi:hypothetical protein
MVLEDEKKVHPGLDVSVEIGIVRNPFPCERRQGGNR